MGFESQNAKKPFVMGTHYNRSEVSGYGTSDNSIKAIHARSGHKVVFTEDESIIITDKSGNEIHLDTTGSNINITAPETMTSTIGSNQSTSVGMNQNNSVGLTQTESVGGIKNVSVGGNFMTNVVGKMMEFIKGNKESEVEQDSQKIVKGERIIHSDKDHKIHSQTEFNGQSNEITNMN